MNDVAVHHERQKNWAWLWRTLAIVFALFILEQDIENLMWSAQVEPGQASMGAGFERAKTEHGYMPVSSVEPRSPFANAGISPGDRVRFDHSYDYAREKFAGETIGLSVVHDGHVRHTVVTAAPVAGSALVADALFGTDMLNGFTCIISALFGLFILWRGGGRATSLLLGMGFVTYGMATALPQLSLSSPAVFVTTFAIGSLNYGSIPILFYAFALRFFSETIHPLSRRHWWFFGAYAFVQYAFTFCLAHYLVTLERLPLAGNGLALSTIVGYAGFAFSFVYLMRGWRRSSADVQQRYALMLIAISAVILSQVIVSGVFFLIPLPPMARDVVMAAADVLAIVSPLLFSYSIFRHRVLDLGFAVNRTLVYGVVSVILLLIFGLLEWAAEHFLPLKTRESNALLDAGIALCIFLIFHRVRDFVEHNVEKLFFRQWHEKEAQLKRFVREAGFILKTKPLMTAFTGALQAFADGAECAVYLADEDGAYHRAEGHLTGAGSHLDADDPFMVTLRADRTATTPLAGAIALALPMIHRTEVVGVVLMGESLGFAYRPDEKEVLAWAAHQVGLDLHALEVERLQHANRALETKYAELKTNLAAVSRALPAAPG